MVVVGSFLMQSVCHRLIVAGASAHSLSLRRKKKRAPLV